MDYQKINLNQVPKHLAIILDGNGRWAKKRMMPRTYGHEAGLKNLRTIAKACDELKMKALTVFCFSTENWNRPDDEVQFLMQAPVDFVNKYLDSLEKSNIKIQVLGRKDKMPLKTLEAFKKMIEVTKDHQGLILNVCFDYGSQYELCAATKEIANEVLDGKLRVNDITPALIESKLFTKDLPPLDLLIRTSGEIRISNFLLWQLSYAELYFTDTYWPDFNEAELEKAILSYQKRTRRFGALGEVKK